MENNTIEKAGFLGSAKNRIIAVLSAVFVGLLVSVILMDYKVGINYFAFSIICFALIAYIMALDENLDLKLLIFWAAVYLAYASMLFRLRMPTALDIVILPTVLVCFTIFGAKDKRENVISTFFYRFFSFPIYFYKIFGMTGSDKKEGKKQKAGSILLGLGISALLLVVIIPLMLGADVLFKELIGQMFTFDNIGDWIGKVIVAAITALAGFGFIYIITERKDTPKPMLPVKSRPAGAPVTVMTVLGVIAAVFIVFAAIQFRYLFFNTGGLPKGYTYTEYAVKGFWEQFVLTLINIVIILTSMHTTKDTEGSSKKTVNIQLVVLTAINAYLLIAAAYKMNLYQQNYGFTFLRCLVYLILLFELIMLGFMAVKVFKRDFPLLKVAVYMTAAYFAVVAMMNLESFSLKQNIKQYEKTGNSEVLLMLYDYRDASPVVRDFYFENYNKLTGDQIKRIENSTAHWIVEDEESWLEFNIGRNKADQVGREIRDYAMK